MNALCTIDGITFTLTKKDFIPILARFIEIESHDVVKEYGNSISEPYRFAGDRLIEDALALVP